MRLAFYFIVGLLLGGGCTYAVSADYAVATLASYHFDRSKPHNERNFGAGLERRRDNWSTAIGYYKNSFNVTTVYVLAGYTPFRIQSWQVGATFGAVTGYGSPLFVAMIATRDWGRFGVNVAMAPTAAAVQVKWRLR